MIVIAKVSVKEGKENEFETKFSKMIEKVEEEEGTLMYRLAQSAENSTDYIVIEEYDSQESLDYHLNTSYFKEIGASLGDVTMGPPKIEAFIEKNSISRK